MFCAEDSKPTFRIKSPHSSNISNFKRHSLYCIHNIRESARTIQKNGQPLTKNGPCTCNLLNNYTNSCTILKVTNKFTQLILKKKQNVKRNLCQTITKYSLLFLARHISTNAMGIFTLHLHQ